MLEERLEKKEVGAIKNWIKRVNKKSYKPCEKRYSYALEKLSLSLEVVGYGKHRVVYDLNNGFVLKVAITLKGIRNNRNEAKLYERTKSHLKKHLAKVIESGRGWIIMEKVDGVVEDTLENRYRVSLLQAAFRNERILPDDIFNKDKISLKTKNLRMSKDGQIVVIDYGNFEMY